MVGFRFAIQVLGCRANQEEADSLRSLLHSLGGREVAFPSPAEVTIVNTCAVTQSAQAQSRQELRRTEKPNGALLIATGCAAQLDPEQLAQIEKVDCVVGNRDKAELTTVLKRLLAVDVDARRGALAAAWGADDNGPAGAVVAWSSDPTPTHFMGRPGPIPRGRSRAVLRIQDGCRYACSYCIVSRLRGRSRSRPADEVVAEAMRVVDAGFKEIVLTGVNLGLYGSGAEDDVTLPELLTRLEALPGLTRLRLSSLEPMTMTDPLLERIVTSRKIARHLHLPIQSGDDEILTQMQRPYDRAALADLIARLRRRWDDFALGVDIIAGFPGESEAAFAQTLALLESLEVSYIHAFAYSQRPGTPAAERTDAVAHAIRTARVRTLRELDAQLRLRFQERLAGRPAQLVIERAEGGTFVGMSGEFVRMTGTALGLAPGDWVTGIAGAPREAGISHFEQD